MTTHIRPLVSSDTSALERVLYDGLPIDLALLHALRVGSADGFIGGFRDGRLVGAALSRRGWICASTGLDAALATQITPHLRRDPDWTSVVGALEPCTAIVHALNSAEPPRVDRVQVFMAVEHESELQGAAPTLRRARPRDLVELLPLVAAYRVADGLMPRVDSDREWLRAHVEMRIRAGSIYVLEEDGRVVFTGAFNFHGRSGSSLGGIYTIPDVRRTGVGLRGTSELCRLALRRGAMATLHVAADNEAALRCYERVGMKPAGELRLTIR